MKGLQMSQMILNKSEVDIGKYWSSRRTELEAMSTFTFHCTTTTNKHTNKKQTNIFQHKTLKSSGESDKVKLLDTITIVYKVRKVKQEPHGRSLSQFLQHEATGSIATSPWMGC